MPSRYEPFGTVMIEAWASKTPLIVAAAAGPKGLVTPDVDAILVPVDDVDALGHAMRRLIAEPEFGRALVSGGYAHYENQFTEAAMVKQYMNFYASIAG
jgi:glycosyltransferase involved in cell wall biosynthesis